MGDYQRLHTDAEAAEIVQPLEPKVHRSLAHRLLFAFSVALTIGVILFFLWGLPCDVQPCVVPQSTVNWEKTLIGIELKGGMHLVGKHLVSILRSAAWGKSSRDFLPHTGGVIALSASTGKTVWYMKLHTTPLYIDCTILSGRRCLVLGESGFLMALDYISGLQVWKMQSRNLTTHPLPQEVDFPLLVPELGELVSLARFKPGPHRLLFVSADNGHITSEPGLKADCFQVFNLTYSRDGVFHYACATRLGESTMMSYELPKNRLSGKVASEPIDYSQKPNDDAVRSEQIIVTNKGSCPRGCQVSISVSNSLNSTVWSYTAERTYAMAPLPLRFRPNTTGFLIKLWQWHNQPLKQSDGITVELIKERIVLITFNKSHLQIVNASQTDITQFCNVLKNECQPQLSFQTQSALLVDLNNDGRQDLISYLVTYQPLREEDHSIEKLSNWELQSKVRVVQLEAELHKLYDGATRH